MRCVSPILAAFSLSVLCLTVTDRHAEAYAAGEMQACETPRSAANALDLYGEQIRFAVFREGKRVGSHTVTFAQRGNAMTVRTEFTVVVPVLMIPAYRYEYRAEEVLRDGCLQSLLAETNDNGTRTTVSAQVNGSKMVVQGPRGTQETAAHLLPTHHWRGEVVKSDQVLNTITGVVNSVQLIDRGESLVKINGQPQSARRYQYVGDLTNDVWYDSQGRWVKMQFRANDGSLIDYVCERCARIIYSNS